MAGDGLFEIWLNSTVHLGPRNWRICEPTLIFWLSQNTMRKERCEYTSLVVHLSGIHIFHYAFSDEHDDDDDDTTQNGFVFLPRPGMDNAHMNL